MIYTLIDSILKKLSKSKATSNNLFENTINILMKVDIENLKSVFTSDMSIFKITTCVSNIVDYTIMLQKITDHINNDVLLSVHFVPTTMEQIYIRDFYLDRKHIHIDVLNSNKEFINASIIFLRVYESKDLILDKPFILQRNLMLTKHIVNNIYTLTRELYHEHQREY